METFWVVGRSSDGVSIISEKSIKEYTAAQVSPEPPLDNEKREEEKEKRSVDDYDVEEVTTTEPLYRYYSRQTTLKSEEQ